MAKVRLIGTIVTDIVTGTVGQQNTKFSKYLVQVSVGGQSGNNPRLAGNSSSSANIRNSFFAVMAYGKQAELPIAKGVTVELDGNLEISKFQLNTQSAAKDAAIVNVNHTTILQGNVAHYAKAYNMLGNLVTQDAEVYNATSTNIYSQKIAIGKKVGEQEFTSFYKIKFFDERGDILFNKQLLNKAKVKSVLVDGSISATYTKKEKDGKPVEYFNCEVNVDDFQIASWASNSSNNQYTNQQSNDSANAYSTATTASAYGDLTGIDEDEIPF
jgi:single-stranded DNA-binding protein